MGKIFGSTKKRSQIRYFDHLETRIGEDFNQSICDLKNNERRKTLKPIFDENDEELKYFER